MNVVIRKRPTQAETIKALRAQVKDLKAASREAIGWYAEEGRKVAELTKALNSTTERLESVIKEREQANALVALYKERLAASKEEILRLEASEIILTIDKAEGDVATGLLGRMLGR